MRVTYPIETYAMRLRLTYDAQRRRDRRYRRTLREQGYSDTGMTTAHQLLGMPLPSAFEAEVTRHIHDVIRRWAGRWARRHNMVVTRPPLLSTADPFDPQADPGRLELRIRLDVAGPFDPELRSRWPDYFILAKREPVLEVETDG